jgi:hypothetical protein
VKDDGRIVGGEEWQEKVYNREDWKKLLRMTRNRRILIDIGWNGVEWIFGLGTGTGSPCESGPRVP